MGYFPETIAAELAGEVVRMARLAECDFSNGFGRYWEGGIGDLATSDGKVWKGTGGLGAISAVESAIGSTAPQITLTMSGIDTSLIGQVIAAENTVKGRDCTIYLQFFDADWAPLDAPYAVYLGLMDVMTVKQQSAAQWTIELTAEGLFTRRGVPPWGYLSDRSQKGRFPGDRGLEGIAAMRLAQPFWPVF